MPHPDAACTCYCPPGAVVLHHSSTCPCTDAPYPVPEPDVTAWDRAEDDYCERGTQGCSVHHTRDSDCQTW